MPEPQNILKFPPKFYWGTATAAFQIEGHPEEYLAKLSDWSEWIDRKDKVQEPTNQGRAVDHYQHMLEDVELIKRLNNNAYRFSFNWARLHRGPGQFDDNTLQFYKSLLHALAGRDYSNPAAIKSRVEPFATLVHFVLPNWLAKEGGWENPNTAKEFANFTRYLAEQFRGQIKFWITHNEPNIFLNFGYESGIWPPGYENNWSKYYQAYQGLVYAHQLAYRTIKEVDPHSQVGFSQNLYAFETPEEHKSYLSNDALPNIIRNQLHNKLFIESCLELDALDFLGVNYYTRFVYKFNPKAKDPANPHLDSLLWGELQNLSSVKTNSLNWEIYPQGLFNVLTDKKFKNLIGNIPIYITENGYCHVENQAGSYALALKNEESDFSKDLNDNYRCKFIQDHLLAVHQAISAGVNIQGYFYWSLLDNFEWALGMNPRFGLVHVNHQDFTRTPKRSYHYYADIAKSNGLKPKVACNSMDNLDNQSYNSLTSSEM